MSRSADNLVMAMMIDIWPRNAAVVDYGVTEANIGAYKNAVRSGKLTADLLHAHIYDSAWLSEQIGAPVNTHLDILLTFEDEDDEEFDDDDEEDEESDEDFDPAAAYHEFMSKGCEYPAPGPNTLSFDRGGTHFILTKKDGEEFPNFQEMDQETFNEALRIWCFR